MAIQLLNWAFRQTDVTGADKWVLIVLANRADKKTHQCFPSLNQIADEAGIDRSTVTRCITHLLEMGKISREKWGTQRTIYTLQLGAPRTQSPGAPRTRCATQLGAPRTQVGAPRTQLDEPASLLTNTENTEETIINHSSPAARDKAADIFADVFRELNKPAEYIFRREDFVWLAKIRKTQHLESKAAPERWREICWNYLASEMGKYTLCDLCSRYEVFCRGPVDRYNKPLGGSNGFGQTKGDITHQNAYNFLRRIDQQDSERDERRAQRGDNRGLHGTIDLPFDSPDGAGHEPDD